MDNSKVSWQQDLSYEDLIKQCPYLARKSGLPLQSQTPVVPQVSEPSLSKSKKKRLKKRLKTLAALNKSEDIPTVQPLLERSVPQNLVEMSVPVSEASIGVKKEGGGKSKTPVKERVPDVVDGEILVSSSKVIREQVLAERDARKKAKQLSKQHKKETCSDQEKPKSLNAVSGLKGDMPSVVDNNLNNDAKTLVVSSPIKSDTKSPVPSNVSANRTEKQNLSSPKDDSQKNQTPTSEKSREEIVAEREAKKKAKQLAKLKKGEKSGGPDSTIQTEASSNTLPNSSELEKFDRQVSKTVVEIKANIPDGDNVGTGKSKSELRAERRAKQEAQRAAKEAEKKLKVEAVENKENKILPSEKPKKLAPEKEAVKEIKLPKTKIVSQQRIKLFSHLHVGLKPAQIQIIQNIHPSLIELGVKYSARIINGSNARCVALLNCLKEIINDYSTPLEKEFSRGLESKLNELTNYLNQCRPMAVSMTNALRHIKSHLNQLPNNISDDEAKRKLLDVIDTFIREQIDVAGEAICETVKKKIANGDVILIYSCSSLLYRILSESFRSGRQFKVIVVDGGPWFEGREMLRRLVHAGLNCTYVQVSAISFIMRQATKVFLGAHALLANGSVMSRAGASLVALAAHSFNVPVLVCCETYKFCERVQTDAFVYNELGSPDDVVKEDERLTSWKSLDFLTPLSLVYDITPPDLVTAVVTELAILPCTSVPVILRVKPSDLVS